MLHPSVQWWWSWKRDLPRVPFHDLPIGVSVGAQYLMFAEHRGEGEDDGKRADPLAGLSDTASVIR